MQAPWELHSLPRSCQAKRYYHILALFIHLFVVDLCWVILFSIFKFQRSILFSMFNFQFYFFQKVPLISDDLELECKGKDKYKCGSNVFWKWWSGTTTHFKHFILPYHVSNFPLKKLYLCLFVCYIVLFRIFLYPHHVFGRKLERFSKQAFNGYACHLLWM